jgi:hypothetical protein
MDKYKVIGKFYEPIGTILELREEEAAHWLKIGRLERVVQSKPKRKQRNPSVDK